MTKHLPAGAVLAALLVLSSEARAVDAGPVPLADFIRDAEFKEVKLSPDGTHVATTRVKDGRAFLQIVRLSDMEPVGAYGATGSREVADFYWPNDKEVLFGTNHRHGTLGLAEPTGDLLGISIDGTRYTEYLTGTYRDFTILDLLDNDADSIVYSRYEGSPLPYVYRLNLRISLHVPLMQSHVRFPDFLTDYDGRIRFMVGTEKDDTRVVLFREAEDRGWQELGRYKPGTGELAPIRFSPEEDKVYIAGNVDASTVGVYLLDLKTKQRELLFRDPVYDAGAVLRGRDRRQSVGIAWSATRQQWKFFDEQHPDAALYQQLRKSLGDRDLDFVNFSKDGNRAVVFAGSDVDPGTYYVLDLQKKAAIARLPIARWINPAQMAHRQPIELKARDGMVLRGYVTVPRSRKDKQRLPMIVLPHGGPHQIRDHWGFDQEAQLLASRGYVVLQVNFRGSSGYGRDFENAGYGEWGEAMQRDVSDATHWAVAQGYADPARMCIYGASYGAYSALMAVVQERDLFRCAAGYAGVYDLEDWIKQSDVGQYDEGRAYIERAIGTDANEQRRRSPVTHAAEIKVPVFLAHGKNDSRTPLSQFSNMRAALVAANKPFEELVKDNEGHGFYSEKNREELYTKLLAFFDRNTAPAPAK